MAKVPPEAVEGLSILGQLPGFLVGLLSSACIAVPLYLKQKREAAESERRIILAIQKQQQQEAGLAEMIVSTTGELSGQHEALLGQFRELKEQFDRVVKDAKYDRALPLAQPYTAVARALAAEAARRQLSQSSETLELSVDLIRRVHASLFPAGFELAGQLRNARVWVGPPGSNVADATFLPPPANEVPMQLAELIANWNRELPTLKSASSGERLKAIANFHHRLVSIHPFLDGNGILARLLTSQQLRELLAIDAHLVESDADYISALRAADAGNLEPLCAYLFQRRSKESAV